MNDLQISLLAIGIVVVLALFAFNGWQQWQYRRRFAPPLKAKYPTRTISEDKHVSAVSISQESLSTESASEIGTEISEQAMPLETALPVSVNKSRPRTQAADEVCSLLDATLDYILQLTPTRPAASDTLARLWEQRFDYGKRIHVCGLGAASGVWEKVIPESPSTYSAFQLALQLVDRSGAVDPNRIADFHAIGRLIATETQAKATLPDPAQAAARAQQLDKFCVTVDHMIGLNIFPSGDHSLPGNAVAQAADQHGLTLQADGAFHLLDEHGHTLFSLSNADNTPLQHHTLQSIWIAGLTLLLDLPRVVQPLQRFDQMAVLAHQLAAELNAVVVDDRRVALSDAGIALIRGQIATVEAAMLAEGIIPGSTQARRLFS